MKKFTLSLAFIFAGLCSMAQSFAPVASPAGPVVSKSLLKKSTIKNPKSTSAANYWLSYSNTMNTLSGGKSDTNLAFTFIDSTLVFKNDNGGTARSPYYALGNILDVLSPNFKNVDGVSWDTTTTYAVDSMSIPMSYFRKSASQVADTILVNLYYTRRPRFQADGTYYFPNQKANYNVDTLFFLPNSYAYKLNGPSKTPTLKTFRVPLYPGDVNLAEKRFKVSFNVGYNALVYASYQFKPGYKYNANDTINKDKNYMFFLSTEEKGKNTYPTYTQNDWNISGIVTKTLRYGKDASGFTGANIMYPTYAFTAPYNLEHHMVSYRVVQGIVGLNEIETVSNGVKVSQNHPNPFSGSTTISYQLPSSSQVSIEIMDITGKQVALFNEGFQTEGNYSFDFYAGNLAKGMYLYTLKAGNTSITKKMVIAE